MDRLIIKYFCLFSLSIIVACHSQNNPVQTAEKFQNVKQLTFDNSGHTLHNTQCFSPDDQWIVFDTRNYDTMIASTGSIAMVNTESGEIKELYHTSHQTEYGPGVGAATFSPTRDRVLFIHGTRNAHKGNPYDFTRRTGVAIDIAKPNQPIFMDARDITPPFTPGALRGGTHAHSWDGAGKWISFTYNDFVIQQRAKNDSSVKDLRTVGIMVPNKPVTVTDNGSQENNSGEMFSVVVAQVTDKPKPGSDDIDKASDEGWIGAKGYRKKDGSWQHHAIAFQGEVTNMDGTKKNEVFVLDLPEDPTIAIPGEPLEGTISSRPNVPKGVIQKRITHLLNGIQGPRHWLRSSPDGTLIAFLQKDGNDIIQIFGVSPNGGKIIQLTNNTTPIQGPFNFSPDGKQLAYLSDNSVCITDIESGKIKVLTPRYSDEEKVYGSVIWSNNGKMLAFNKYVKEEKTGEVFLQIFLIKQ